LTQLEPNPTKRSKRAKKPLLAWCIGIGINLQKKQLMAAQKTTFLAAETPKIPLRNAQGGTQSAREQHDFIGSWAAQAFLSYRLKTA
jgi:hypothetical protein